MGRGVRFPTASSARRGLKRQFPEVVDKCARTHLRCWPLPMATPVTTTISFSPRPLKQWLDHTSTLCVTLRSPWLGTRVSRASMVLSRHNPSATVSVPRRKRLPSMLFSIAISCGNDDNNGTTLLRTLYGHSIRRKCVLVQCYTDQFR